ncbi:DUF87 domain-containing protein [Leuconostocaceae bacterium ESL0958]|nr:DUF87 domain-containing protein [Leuconostocaceae bacterium ESL0958]
MFLKSKSSKKRRPVAALRKQGRLAEELPSTQDSLHFTSIDQTGLMRLPQTEYSQQYQLNDIAYEAAGEMKQDDVVESYARAINKLDHHDRLQLLVVNERVGKRAIEKLLMPLADDSNDVYRQEINQLITEKFEKNENEFNAKRYLTLTTESMTAAQGSRDLNTLAQSFAQSFQDNAVDLQMTPLDGQERIDQINQLTNPGVQNPTVRWQAEDDSKDYVAPANLHFDNAFFKVNERYARVLYIRNYPTLMEDKLIRELLKLNEELAISLHASPYNMQEAKRKVQKIATLNKIDLIRQQKSNFKEGIGEDLVSGLSTNVKDSTESLMQHFEDNTEKLFVGTFAVMFFADSRKEMKRITDDIKGVGQAAGVNFETAYNWQEEGFNSILPFGKNYLNQPMAKEHIRDMTTLNIATQVPFTSVEMQSEHGEFFGQNQITGNVITIDRKNRHELLTPSGLILGTSGSGKSVATKYQIMNTLLNHPNDRIVIVDPESEYLPIGQALGAEILDISTGTNNHLNLLDLPKKEDLDREDQKLDLVKEKTNLLVSLLEEVVELSAVDRGIIDRVTGETYRKYDQPTLKEWQLVLEEQPDPQADDLANAMYPYTMGSQDIFAYPTNIDLSSRFLIFNTKNLDRKLKTFAMKVILDQIWKQVVVNQNKAATWLYFDEIQVNFDTADNAQWFTNLWARVRKYGAIPTGITQNIMTLLEKEAGQKMVMNTEFMILLRQKGPDLKLMSELLGYDEVLLRQFCGGRPAKGTGIIQADNVMIPFENEIPENTKLFGLLNTDVVTDVVNE